MQEKNELKLIGIITELTAMIALIESTQSKVRGNEEVEKYPDFQKISNELYLFRDDCLNKFPKETRKVLSKITYSRLLENISNLFD